MRRADVNWPMEVIQVAVHPIDGYLYIQGVSRLQFFATNVVRINERVGHAYANYGPDIWFHEMTFVDGRAVHFVCSKTFLDDLRHFSGLGKSIERPAEVEFDEFLQRGEYAEFKA